MKSREYLPKENTPAGRGLRDFIRNKPPAGEELQNWEKYKGNEGGHRSSRQQLPDSQSWPIPRLLGRGSHFVLRSI